VDVPAAVRPGISTPGENVTEHRCVENFRKKAGLSSLLGQGQARRKRDNGVFATAAFHILKGKNEGPPLSGGDEDTQEKGAKKSSVKSRG